MHHCIIALLLASLNALFNLLQQQEDSGSMDTFILNEAARINYLVQNNLASVLRHRNAPLNDVIAFLNSVPCVDSNLLSKLSIGPTIILSHKR